MSCLSCERDVPIENKDTQLCASCNRDARNNADLYPMARQMFLEMCVKNESVCPIRGTPITMDSDIHHMKGRIGYASQEKREKGISLLIDVDFFLAVSREGHIWIDANTELALLRGFSLLRLNEA